MEQRVVGITKVEKTDGKEDQKHLMELPMQWQINGVNI